MRKLLFLYDHCRALEREKVTFDLFDLTGRITDASFENVYVHMQKKYPLG